MLKRISAFKFICLLFFITVVVLQWLGGAFYGEFGAHPDEAGHYITGLMVRDYIAAFLPTSPMEFAENYYIHYPKVAFGHWPPFFYIVQAAWTLLFTPSRFSMLLLMALLTTLLAATVYEVIRTEYGSMMGIGAGLLLVFLPLIQEYSGMVMAEILVALLSFWAVLYFGRFLNEERWQDAVGFGVIASLTIMTKLTGLALALVPLLGLLFSRRYSLVRRPSFWLPAVIVLALCGPWHLLTLAMTQNGIEEEVGLRYTTSAIFSVSWEMVKLTGVGLSLLIATGFVVRIIKPFREGKVDGKWAAAAALVLSVWAFQCVVPVAGPRHLIAAVPPLLMFLTAGVAWTAARLPLSGLKFQHRVAVLALVTTLVFAKETFAIPKQKCQGYKEVAQVLLSREEFRNSVFLISSDSNGEGAFISEVAMREQRPGHIILRASKVLAESLWTGKKYSLSYQTPEEVMNYLDGVPVGILVIDMAPNQFEHHRQLIEMLKAYPERWELIGSFPQSQQTASPTSEIRVYRLVGHENRPVGKIRISMKHMLNKSIEK